MTREYLKLKVSGPGATDLARRMFPACPCPSLPRKRLSAVFTHLVEGAFITMTTGQPVSVTFPTVLTKGQPITISAVDQDNNPTPPIGVTAVSDSPSVIVTTDATDPLTFWLQGVPGSAGTANVTFTDASGDTVVVSATTVEPPVSTTLIATPGTPV